MKKQEIKVKKIQQLCINFTLLLGSGEIKTTLGFIAKIIFYIVQIKSTLAD